jgi:hypothetical protein
MPAAGVSGGEGPRRSGAAGSTWASLCALSGRSPHARSSLGGVVPAHELLGSISACAEQPGRACECCQVSRVDLRMRGAAQCSGRFSLALWGRSPHARSSRDGRADRRHAAGSISACAEQPLARGSATCRVRVDLRMRGAAVDLDERQRPRYGRSPHARSSQRVEEARRDLLRSISACAEQPCWPSWSACRAGVDLRMRGAAALSIAYGGTTMGRSPHARSSHARRGHRDARVGSISACAEQPSGPRVLPRAIRVDLRMRGAALLPCSLAAISTGRSPHARSSPVGEVNGRKVCGSISACAEQPAWGSMNPSPSRVDLRMRGAAPGSASTSTTTTGRSPHARSSLLPRAAAVALAGSISACAEQPRRASAPRRAPWVDLRMRGAAMLSFASRWHTTGRSPHARSSPPVAAQQARRRGSISACAEQPRSARCSSRARRVDLRMRGAAVSPGARS